MTEPLVQPASPASPASRASPASPASSASSVSTVSTAAWSTDEAAVNEIVGRGPAGTFAVAGIATAIVVGLYFAFYFFAYLPRGIVQ